MVVRSRGEYEAGHIPEVQHLQLDELDRRMDEVSDGPVLIACRGKQVSYTWHKLTKKRPERPSVCTGCATAQCRWQLDHC